MQAICPFTEKYFSPAELGRLKITVMGLGLFGGGRGLTDFLCGLGARVLVTDLRDAKSLRPSIEALRGHSIEWVLGRHREEDFLGADLVFVNPAVPRDAPLIRLCRDRGIPLETEMNLFFKLCRGKICGITGSNGKTTTTSLAGQIFRNAFPRTRIGGNLGISLLGEVKEIREDDWAILELSSFQLEDLQAIPRRPDIALITNVSPNHLNRHSSYGQYQAAKRVILEAEPRPGPRTGAPWAILNGDDAAVRSWAGSTHRRVMFFGRGSDILPQARGVWVVGRRVIHSDGGRSRELFREEDLSLRGRFNLVNAAGAAAAALAAECSPAAISDGVRAFKPIEHRLEFIRRCRDVEFYNDSKATTPESALRAIDALGPDVILVAGGSDKGTSFRQLGYAIARRTRGVVLIGETAPKIRAAVQSARGEVPVLEAGSLEEAVQRASGMARPGFRIALSPACASFDMFANYEERGNRFKEIVQGLDPDR